MDKLLHFTKRDNTIRDSALRVITKLSYFIEENNLISFNKFSKVVSISLSN